MIDARGSLRARLEPTGPALGLMPELPFGVASERLAVGETLFAYTDGVVDARDSAEAPFGEDRLMKGHAAVAPVRRSMLRVKCRWFPATSGPLRPAPMQRA
jgi:serine phosphatase RsbU (regulator of sigma subunit)